jgi:hypothetical protein
MDAALNPNQADPRHELVARADEELAHAHEQIARAGEDIARAEKQLSKLERDAAGQRKHAFDRPAVRGLTGVLLAACIAAVAVAQQSSYGGAASGLIARWTPQRVAAPSPSLENPERLAGPSPSAVQAATKTTPSAQPAGAAQITADDIALTAAALSPAMTQLLQSMSRDLAALAQGIEQLKASQEQMARDQASAAQQLKAGQDNIARLMAKVSDKASEDSSRPRTSTPPPRR